MKSHVLTLVIALSFSLCSGSFAQTKKTVKTTQPVKTTKTVKTVKTPVKTEPSFMLVKIKTNIFKDFVGASTVRQRIEDKIDEQLEATKNGEWVSGDLGPGEANILLKVLNIDQATKAILKILDEEKFDKSIFIGIRISTAQIPWSYKVIYPSNYKGTI